MNREVEGMVLRIERTSIHDGEGLRTVVFLKGCPLSCSWCSTPESQREEPQRGYLSERCRLCAACVTACPTEALSIASETIVWDSKRCQNCLLCVSTCPNGAVLGYGGKMTVSQVVAEISRDEVFYYHSGGGVTISGGECLQQPEFVAAILKECRRRGINTAIETSLFAPWRYVEKVIPYLTSLYVDLKHPDVKEHKKYVGVDHQRIHANLQKVDDSRYPFALHLRIPLIPGINDSDKDLVRMITHIETLGRVVDIEILPYHRLGVATYSHLGRDYDLAGVDNPNKEYILAKLNFLRNRTTIEVKAGGGYSS